LEDTGWNGKRGQVDTTEISWRRSALCNARNRSRQKSTRQIRRSAKDHLRPEITIQKAVELSSPYIGSDLKDMLSTKVTVGVCELYRVVRPRLWKQKDIGSQGTIRIDQQLSNGCQIVFAKVAWQLLVVDIWQWKFSAGQVRDFLRIQQKRFVR